MTPEDSGLGHAYAVPPAADGPLADLANQPDVSIQSKPLQDRFPARGVAPNEIESTQDDTPVIASEKDYGRVTATELLSSISSESLDAVTDKNEEAEIDAKGDSVIAAKAQQIRDACVRGDFPQLQALAGSEGGFLTDALRQIAWPVLLGIPIGSDGHIDEKAAAAAAGVSPGEDGTAWEKLPPHRDEEQVQLDVNRAFVHYPNHPNDAEEARQKRALSALIVEVLRRQPFLCYFQGFHDICQVFLLVLPPALRTPIVVRLAVLRIRDFMLPTIDAAVQQLLLLPDILRMADPPLWDHLRLAQHPRPFFALSGTLTMYAHDVQSLGTIARLFDVLLARPPAFSLYLFAAIVCAHRAALFATPADEPEMLHHILSKLPGRTGSSESHDDDDGFGGSSMSPPLDELIATATQLATSYPPHTLPAWRSIPASSVLKTADDCVAGKTGPKPLAAGLSVADGERLFHEHVRELEQAERRRQQVARVRQVLWQYRGPARAVGVAVLVGVLAVALRRSGVGTGTGSSFLPGPVAKISSLFSRLGIFVG